VSHVDGRVLGLEPYAVDGSSGEAQFCPECVVGRAFHPIAGSAGPAVTEARLIATTGNGWSAFATEPVPFVLICRHEAVLDSHRPASRQNLRLPRTGGDVGR
jgi:hypothetical protein